MSCAVPVKGNNNYAMRAIYMFFNVDDRSAYKHTKIMQSDHYCVELQPNSMRDLECRLRTAQDLRATKNYG
eukprot:3943422-Lingulodinium_polyedra.AAC.1